MIEPVTAHPSVMTRLGVRFGRNTALFSIGNVLSLGLSLVSAVVLIQFLGPPQYGRLAILTFFASLVTTVYNLGSLQGTNLMVFGSSGDDDADDDSDEEGPSFDRRGALTTGLVVTVGVCLLGTWLIYMGRHPIGRLLAHSGSEAVMLAAGSGALGAVWRLGVNVLRLERRPLAFVLLTTSRPVFVLAVTIPLVASGGGVRGALLGLVLGTGASLLLTLAAGLRSYAVRFEPRAVPEMFRRGAAYVPISFSFWMLHTADVYVLSLFASNASVGTYRFGSRLAVFVSYFASSFLQSWAPMSRTATFFAAEKRDRRRLESSLILYYWLCALAMTLGVALASRAVMDIAPASYATAARVVPTIALGWLLYGLFMVLYRSSSMPGKRPVYVVLAMASAALFLGAGVTLAPVMGAQGVAVGSVIAFGVLIPVLVLVFRHRGHPLPIPYWRMIAAFGAAAALFGAGRAGASALPAAPWVAPLLAFACFVALVVFVLVPQAERGTLRSLALGLLPSPGSRDQLRRQVASLDLRDRELLGLALDRHRSLREVCESTGYSESEVQLRTVWALREVAGLPGPAASDLRIGRYLLSRDARANRDVLARAMRDDGVELEELDLLESVHGALLREARRGHRLRSVHTNGGPRAEL